MFIIFLIISLSHIKTTQPIYHDEPRHQTMPSCVSPIPKSVYLSIFFILRIYIFPMIHKHNKICVFFFLVFRESSTQHEMKDNIIIIRINYEPIKCLSLTFSAKFWDLLVLIQEAKMHILTNNFFTLVHYSCKQ